MEKNNEIMALREASTALPAGVGQALEQMGEIMRGMADMLRVTNERITAMEREVRLLTKVTPAQANAIHEAIRSRAAQVCAQHRAEGGEKAAANAIRRAVRLTTGISSVRDLPRCEYGVALEQVQLWDDYKAMKAIKARIGEGGKKP